jgi:1-acyl-sn-glycerol-3-phosphate acyltransferase
VNEVEQRLKGGPMSLPSRAFYYSAHWLTRLLALLYFRGYVHDADNLPRTGAVIIAPVHRSNLDVPVLGATCPRRLRYFAKDSLFRNRFWTWLLTLVGAFPVHRDATDRQALEAAVRILERGEPLAMFPEGERKSGPVVQPLLRGVAYVAGRTQVPILPVGIGGSEHAMPKGQVLPRPSRLVYLYGETIDPPRAEGKRVSRSEIDRVTAELYEAVQSLFDEAQRRAGTPNQPPT